MLRGFRKFVFLAFCLMSSSLGSRRQRQRNHELVARVQPNRVSKPLASLLFAICPRGLHTFRSGKKTAVATSFPRSSIVHAVDALEEKYGVTLTVPLYRKVFEARERLFGELDPDTVASRAVLADKLFAIGQINEAVELACTVLQNKIKLYGAQDPVTQAAKIRLAVMLEASGSPDRASRIAKEALEWWRSNRDNDNFIGRDDFANLVGLDLAQVLLKMGDASSAEELVREVLLIRNLQLGPTHPDTITGKKDLIAVLRALGRLTEAEELGRATLKELGADDPSSGVVMQELSAVLEASGQSESAIKLQGLRSTSEAMASFVNYLDEETDRSELNADVDIPSFMKLELDEDGEPNAMRFTYVDEVQCIGCTYCATHAKMTFGMVPDTGRARSFLQCNDDPETVEEAIDCCPVSCIAYVDLDDLIILETEREDIRFDSYNGLNAVMSGGQGQKMINKPSRAKFATMDTCRTCPTNGCKNCPMYGEGRNPAYLAKKAAMEAKRAKRLGVKSVDSEVLDMVFVPEPSDPENDEALTADGEVREASSKDDSVGQSDSEASAEKTEQLLDLLFSPDSLEDEP